MAAISSSNFLDPSFLISIQKATINRSVWYFSPLAVVSMFERDIWNAAFDYTALWLQSWWKNPKRCSVDTLSLLRAASEWNVWIHFSLILYSKRLLFLKILFFSVGKWFQTPHICLWNSPNSLHMSSSFTVVGNLNAELVGWHLQWETNTLQLTATGSVTSYRYTFIWSWGSWQTSDNNTGHLNIH